MLSLLHAVLFVLIRLSLDHLDGSFDYIAMIGVMHDTMIVRWHVPTYLM